MTQIPLLVAIVLSLAIIAALWRGDPKRRRVAGLGAIAPGANLRRFMVVLLLLPGLVLALLGDSAAFLVWLGSCAIGGWLIAQIRPRLDRK